MIISSQSIMHDLGKVFIFRYLAGNGYNALLAHAARIVHSNGGNYPDGPVSLSFPCPYISKPIFHCRRGPIIVVATCSDDDIHQGLLFTIFGETVSAHCNSQARSEKRSRRLSIRHSYTTYIQDCGFEIRIDNPHRSFMVRAYTRHTRIIGHKQDVGKPNALNGNYVPIMHVPDLREHLALFLIWVCEICG